MSGALGIAMRSRGTHATQSQPDTTYTTPSFQQAQWRLCLKLTKPFCIGMTSTVSQKSSPRRVLKNLIVQSNVYPCTLKKETESVSLFFNDGHVTILFIA